MTLTQKETDLLKDLKGQEQLCIEKYGQWAEKACSEELSSLFRALADVERGHLTTVNELLAGKVTTPSASSSSPLDTVQTGKVDYASEEDKKRDAFLCADMLTTEKHVSAVYNTGIFEFSDPQARKTLNHIQSEEQQHGLKIYEFMSANAMYQ
ncbi:MAG: spore coat protein [Clostridia bacterium]|nr:spore coat protein [Clostridia bacterium]